MCSLSEVGDGWQKVAHPPSLFRRYEFQSYSHTREFLERLASLSKESSLYPDLGFGKTHVNVTIHATGGGLPTEAEIDFARRAATLASADMS
jgi:pterin-4a-carbinolamine dehydratase